MMEVKPYLKKVKIYDIKTRKRLKSGEESV